MPFTGPVPFHTDSMAYGNKEGKVETHRVRTQSLNVGDLVLFSNLKRIVLSIETETSFGNKSYYVHLVTPTGKKTIKKCPAGFCWNVIKAQTNA